MARDDAANAQVLTRPPGWRIPDYSIVFSAGRRQKYCVVIPVLNEGGRIARLLERMAALNIADVADIAIVDGGSRDGSLDRQMLQQRNVNALLVKRGPGKLSAQLRCAYAFAATRGYDGIITIDGNDKDDPGAIPRFIESLDAGADFVQASRFLVGGIAENTPMIRDLAIRYVHAPLLSFSSGFHWTDTTQGFRGYSRRVVVDPRVAMFRDVFDSYELLAYLSHRLPRLAYRCCEIPTARRYPNGEVPTKITSLRGNLAVFQILVNACLGRYDPTEAEQLSAIVGTTSEPRPGRNDETDVDPEHQNIRTR